MKRYLIFRWSRYYPSGGANDFVTSYETMDEAKKHPRDNDDLTYGSYQIWDIENPNVVWESEDRHAEQKFSDWVMKTRDDWWETQRRRR